MRTTTSTLDIALQLAADGNRVLPCHGIVDGGCSCSDAGCGSPGKHPLVRRGLHEATTDQQTIERWWSRWPHANVAVRTGVVSDLVVLDIDGEAGRQSLERLNSIHRGLPPTTTVHTGSGGLHLYFLHPGIEIPNRASSVLGTGIDVRGDGGYVVAPPSRHPSGARYELSNPGVPRHLPPTWLTALLAKTAGPRGCDIDLQSIRADRGVSAWAGTAVDRELARVTSAAEGQRNHTLNRSAFVLGQIVGGGHLDRDRVADLLHNAGISTGLSEREVRRTVSSGLTAGERLPRHPPERPRPQPMADVASQGIEL